MNLPFRTANPAQLISKEHPRVLGSRSRLQAMAKERPDAYKRMADVARNWKLDAQYPKDDFSKQLQPNSKLISMALVAAIENDKKLAREAVDHVLERYITKPLPYGHVPFGTDVAMCALAYDLCYEAWTPAEREACHTFVGEVRDCNVWEEPSPFHNGWFGYKMWGFGIACLAMMHEWPRAAEMWHDLDREYRERAAPALDLAGEGGGFGEGFYVSYWIYPWLFFMECARLCANIDYYQLAPKFYKNRAIAGMFETYPGFHENGSRRTICIGDGRGRFFKVDRDHDLASRRMLCNVYKDDPSHQAVQAYNAPNPRMTAGELAYRDFLWNEPNLKAGNLDKFRLSHCAPGPGYAYARSSWKEDATYFFFKCGKRFTAHQHQDVGHFYIHKHAELASEAGHYDTFGGLHDVNFYTRTIAHNSILVHDPNEKFAHIRAYQGASNDGGQSYPWSGNVHHNGAAMDLNQWFKLRELFDIADLLAADDHGEFYYTAGDATRAYSSHKLELFTRQIVFLRPDTFVIFDRVTSTKPEFKKSWLLQAAKPPTGQAPNLVVTNGQGRLFVQTLLPENPVVTLHSGNDLYTVDGKHYPASLDTGPSAECRIEVSPSMPAKADCFLHVLTTANADASAAPKASVSVKGEQVVVEVAGVRVTFLTNRVGGSVEINGRTAELRNRIVSET